MFIVRLVIMFTVFASSSAYSKEDIIEAGFSAFKKGGAALAWPAWAKGAPLEGSKELMSNASQFGSIDAYYGKYENHEYIDEKVLGPRNKVVFVIMNLEGGPVYGTFTLFKKSDGSWIAPNFMFHTQIQQIWPQCMYSNCTRK